MKKFLALLLLVIATPAIAQDYNPWASSPPAHKAAVSRGAHTGGGSLVRTSWYGGGERLNRHTASGAVFRPNGLSAAHRSLPLGTRLQVTYNGHAVVVVVNDRGPAAWTGRQLDLSRDRSNGAPADATDTSLLAALGRAGYL